MNLTTPQQQMYSDLLISHGKEVADNYLKVCQNADSQQDGHRNIFRRPAPIDRVKLQGSEIIRVRPGISEPQLFSLLSGYLQADVAKAINESIEEGAIAQYQRFLPNGLPLDEHRKFVPVGVPVPTVPVHALSEELRARANECKNNPIATKTKGVLPPARIERKDKNTERIREAAIALRDKGMFFTLADVAKLAGVSEDTVRQRHDICTEIYEWRKELPTEQDLKTWQAIAHIKAAIEKLSKVRARMTLVAIAAEADLNVNFINARPEVYELCKAAIREHNATLCDDIIMRRYQKLNNPDRPDEFQKIGA